MQTETAKKLIEKKNEREIHRTRPSSQKNRKNILLEEKKKEIYIAPVTPTLMTSMHPARSSRNNSLVKCDGVFFFFQIKANRKIMASKTKSLSKRLKTTCRNFCPTPTLTRKKNIYENFCPTPTSTRFLVMGLMDLSQPLYPSLFNIGSPNRKASSEGSLKKSKMSVTTIISMLIGEFTSYSTAEIAEANATPDALVARLTICTEKTRHLIRILKSTLDDPA
jgi:hypothetical protein